jgi:hypothetical protein
MDDTFVLFNDKSHAPLFLNYLNSLHSNIDFTMEIENNNTLSFLDVQVQQIDGKFYTSIFRKPTFTGLGMSFFSFTPIFYKINAIKTLIHRAYSLSSSYKLFSDEINFLTNFFSNNGFPQNMLNLYVKKFLDTLYNTNESSKIITVPKDITYISLPYIGQQSYDMIKYFKNILANYYPQVNFQFVLVNPFSIKSLFRFKDKLPIELHANIIYKFTCETCKSFYIGSSTKQFKIRYSQHLGTSFRTGRPLTTPNHSSPRIHCEKEQHPFSKNNFTIIDYATSVSELRLLESLYIFKQRPPLNTDQSAAPLNIVQ